VEARLKLGSRFASWLVAALALAAAVPSAAVTIPSPLTFRVSHGVAVERAAAAGDRLLDLQPAALARLRSVPLREAVRLEQFPFAPDATGDVVLERFEVASPDARILVRGERGESSLPLPPVVHFEGHLEGDLASRVYIGIPGAFLIATVKTSAGLVYVGPRGTTEGPAQHVLRRSDSPESAELAPLEWHCDVEELPRAPVGAEYRSAGGESPFALLAKPAAASLSATSATSLKDAAISIETDQELLAKFGGNVSSMSSYITTLLAQNSLIYERDVGVHLTVNRVQAWTSTDPYVSTATRSQLDEVGDWWHANRPKASYPRTTVVFLSGKPVSGGIAWLNVLCMNDFSQGGHWGGAYAVVQIAGNYPSNPWDLLASAHEMGHNFGSPHTHCFSPPIDMCYGSEGGCYSGPSVNPGPNGGTIMSYCHLLSGGYGNIDFRFHERCINEEMLPEINSVSCLTTVSDPPAVASFYTLTPCRVLDTRNPSGPYGGPALGANTQRSFAFGGRCGIPATARAVSVNVTVTQGNAPGVLKLFPSGIAVPTASSINYRGGQTRANNSFSQLSSGGSLTIRCEQISGNVHAIIDVNGYYQ
jgi:hypothetical protein